MITIGNRKLDTAPQIALSISDQESNEDIAKHSIAVLELRVDKFSQRDMEFVKAQLARRRETGFALLLTVRTQIEEGGDGSVSEDEKRQIFHHCIDLVDAADIELGSSIRDELIALAKEHGKVVILSSHNFNETPGDDVLEALLVECLNAKADIVKIAAFAQNEEDVKRLGEFTKRNRDKNVITMSLGEIGSSSRITFPASGSLLTYSFLGQPMAPGQLPIDVLEQKLREYYKES